MTFFISVMAFFFISCKEEIKDAVSFKYDPELVPMLSTDSVTMLISDSGLIRYKMIAKTWDVFEEAKDPYWLFPEKIYLEQYDTAFTVEAIIKADSAWNFTRRKLWQLRGHVFIRNKKNETFTGEELFWDERTQKVYSNKELIIDSPDEGKLPASRFESNQQMTEYKFYRLKDAEMYYREEDQAAQDTVLSKTE